MSNPIYENARYNLQEELQDRKKKNRENEENMNFQQGKIQ